MKLRGDRVPGRSGTLCQRTKKKKLQNGQIQEYPLVSVERDAHNVLHWFWHYQILKSCMTICMITLSLSMYSTTSFAFNPQH
ncbi:hypothetical protein [Chamaesiphon minutus]|uniref:Uncharacterized protein n=1 Tax=Chamaesiphon minutus (strain ATCC 27169 / PCC 6605) TaxID=1173020 RepID=K9UEW0_CHAP6|nr:hypothetical protein [Chamaesiphon minutus]AFY93188.1 hypothetical protein Cha6605_2095 [Chamaesiphon minutus PCC 6605]